MVQNILNSQSPITISPKMEAGPPKVVEPTKPTISPTMELRSDVAPRPNQRSKSRPPSETGMRDVKSYLRRIGLRRAPQDLPPTLETLVTVMAAHNESVPFENIDVARGLKISVDASSLERKMLTARRGGYCVEMNSLLRSALVSLGFSVTARLCRVRAGKREEQATTLTHCVLVVRVRVRDRDRDFLVDVGWGKPLPPFLLHKDGVVQADPVMGEFRLVPIAVSTLSNHNARWTELQERSWRSPDVGAWRPMYRFRVEEPAPAVDLELSNWWSCSHPSARFVNELFASMRRRGNDSERADASRAGPWLHVLHNSRYVVRRESSKRREPGAETVEIVRDRRRLLEVLADGFGIVLNETAMQPDELRRLDAFLRLEGWR
jgi:N-hydroxyarylamine O-acetyltransferase